jgi:hypothetical protein
MEETIEQIEQALLETNELINNTVNSVAVLSLKDMSEFDLNLLRLLLMRDLLQVRLAAIQETVQVLSGKTETIH